MKIKDITLFLSLTYSIIMSTYAFYHSTKQNQLIESNINFISKIKNRILEVEKIVDGTDRILDKGNKVIDKLSEVYK